MSQTYSINNYYNFYFHNKSNNDMHTHTIILKLFVKCIFYSMYSQVYYNENAYII